MSHCHGCGGTFKEGPWKGFEHILGCGWQGDVEEDDRRTPSKRRKQLDIIVEGLDVAGVPGTTPQEKLDKADLFAKEVLKLL